MELSKIFGAKTPWKLLHFIDEYGTSKSRVENLASDCDIVKNKSILINNFRIFSLWSNSVLYKQRSLDEEPSVLLDLNELAPDGTLSLSQYYFSNDGTLIGYKVSKSGSDWSEIKIRNVESGQDYPETLKRVKFTDISFTHDNKGFFYAVKLFLYNFMKNASTGQKTIFTSSIFFLLWLSY